ncbi:Phosphohydroxythreonine aminotransferase [Cladobotryum mycophilum]|uniref:Phosphohydroxythreonine aminotransferase n=1 Tax=Cladobotryum mycophilum TaxID=491253 RepID=A0ABR0SNE4_9HYPO
MSLIDGREQPSSASVGGKFGTIPDENRGVEFPGFPKCLLLGPDSNGHIVAADISSNILSRRVPIKNSFIIFFNAQKNPGCTRVAVVIISESLLAPQLPQPSASPMRSLNLPIPPTIFQYCTIFHYTTPLAYSTSTLQAWS